MATLGAFTATVGLRRVQCTLSPCPVGCTQAYCHALLQVFNISQGMSIRPVVSINHSSRPVISLASAFQSRRGGWAEDMGCELVSCDDEGSIRVWQAHSSSSYLESGVSMQAKAPCCSLAVRKGFIVAGGSDGCVRIYNLVSCFFSLLNTLVGQACQNRTAQHVAGCGSTWQ